MRCGSASRTRRADDQLWYYGELLRFFEERRPGPLVEDLRRAVDELADLVAADAETLNTIA